MRRTDLFIFAGVVVLFVVCILIALYLRNQHKHSQPKQPPSTPPKSEPDPRRTDTELMPRIDPDEHKDS